MKKQILNIGKYFITDREGFLVSDVANNKIPDEWKDPIRDFLFVIKKECANKIHSIYLRGSVAVGTAIIGVSDIDFVIITNEPIKQDEKNKLWCVVNDLNKLYPFITRFDVGFYFKKELIEFVSSKEIEKLPNIIGPLRKVYLKLFEDYKNKYKYS